MSFEEKITLVQALVTLLVAAGEMTQAELADHIGMTR